MPRTARKKTKPHLSTTPVPVPVEPLAPNRVKDGHQRLTICRDCGKQRSDNDITDRYCSRCRPFAIVKALPGGNGAFQERENYVRESYGPKKSIPNATRKPMVGTGIGPPHFLDQTPIRLRDVLGKPSPLTTLRQGSREAPMKTFRQQFAEVTITERARCLFTEKEAEAVGLFVDGGMGMREIGRALPLPISAVAVLVRLRSALGKIQGVAATTIMDTDDIEALEAAGKVRAIL